MLESLRVADVATYTADGQSMASLSRFNYIYGPNAAGKTTLSKLIASPEEACFTSCSLRWKNADALQSFVYNRDFVSKNFSASTQLKGIFTLGEESVAAIQAIATAKKERDTLAEKIVGLATTLCGVDGQSGKIGELSNLRAALKERCWEQKKKHDGVFQYAFATYGVRGDSEKFLSRTLSEWESNTSEVEPIELMTERAVSVFGEAPQPVTLLPLPAVQVLLDHEKNSILAKRVVGREDVDISAMIVALGNSDWVKEGRVFFDANDGHCPFCQQKAPHSLEHSLAEYFDETFAKDSEAISALQASYSRAVSDVQTAIDALLVAPPRFLDAERIRKAQELLEAQAAINAQKLREKVKEPSLSISLAPLEQVLSGVTEAVVQANENIKKHNAMVASLASEKKRLVGQVWQHIVRVELKQELADFQSKSSALGKAVESLKAQISTAETAVRDKEREIRDLERSTTSTRPTVDAINATLASFNFRSFKISEAGSNTYKLIREDGTDARETLSEGERTFVTFLYFYNLLKGSDTESGITKDRIVVFDDPVSSLDSDILFIVSSLIREAIADVRDGRGLIKQVFVLTHNVYFHKEVTYSNKRGDACMNEETFWTIKKGNGFSEIVKHDCNPVKTSYELLWHDVRNPEGAGITIQNTLRRIIESYFKILGGVDKEEILAAFSGPEKSICSALMSWVNDGSHGVHDDLFVGADMPSVEVYLRTFHRIFESSGHESHYRMMMGADYIPLRVEEATAREIADSVSATTA